MNDKVRGLNHWNELGDIIIAIVEYQGQVLQKES